MKNKKWIEEWLEEQGYEQQDFDEKLYFRDYGELSMLYDIKHDIGMCHITGYSDDVLKFPTIEEFIVFTETLNKLQWKNTKRT